MPHYTDQTGRTIELNEILKRIVSLVPSQTEFLFDIGLGQQVVGVTKFCIHPEEAIKTKKIIGGTKSLKLELIRELNPDLIIANKEENRREEIEQLSKEFPVWISDIITLQDALAMMKSIGDLTNRKTEAQHIIQNIQAGFAVLHSNKQDSSIRTAYLIWNKPYMAAGGNTFINEMIIRCGLINVFEDLLRYPELSLEQLRSADFELLLLSSEPYPFKQKHIDELQVLLPNTKIKLVDGEMFTWYGSRLQYSPDYFAELREETVRL